MLAKLLGFLKNFDSPKCPLCKKEKEAAAMLCPRCQVIVTAWQRETAFCPKCGRAASPGKLKCECHDQKIYYEQLLACTPYQGIYKQSVHRLKYGGKTHYARTMGSLMANLLQNRLLKARGEEKLSIIPIPLSPRKLAVRGYNQAYLLAKEISKELQGEGARAGLIDSKILLEPALLVKQKEVPSQIGLGRKERLHNLQEAFTVDKSKIDPESSYLLVDDIFTTGATANAGAKALKEAGASTIHIVVWAMAAGKEFIL